MQLLLPNFDLLRISSSSFSLEETQFSVCNFQEICKRISNVWKVPQLQTDEKISFESRARFISLKNPSFDSWYWGTVSFCQLCKYLISLKLWDRILKLKINIQMKRALSLRNSSHFKKQIKTKSIATIKNCGQCNSFLSDRNFFAAILNIRVIAITKSCFWEQTLQWKTNFVAKKQPNKISFAVDLVKWNKNVQFQSRSGLVNVILRFERWHDPRLVPSGLNAGSIKLNETDF